MEKHDFLTDHYEVFLIASNIALMAMVIFAMNLHRTFQIGLLIASALFLVFVLHASGYEEPPCGAPIGLEGIARPRPGFELPEK